MSAIANPVIGAVVKRDGKLEPVEGADPSTPGTYRADASAASPDANAVEQSTSAPI